VGKVLFLLELEVQESLTEDVDRGLLLSLRIEHGAAVGHQVFQVGVLSCEFVKNLELTKLLNDMVAYQASSSCKG